MAISVEGVATVSFSKNFQEFDCLVKLINIITRKAYIPSDLFLNVIMPFRHLWLWPSFRRGR